MIYAITGKTGGGKTYETVKNFIIPCIENGRRIVTNIPLNLEHFRAVYGDEKIDELIIVVEYDFHTYGNERPLSTPEEYEKYQDWRNEKGQSVYFFLDEAHLSIPQGRAKTPVLEYYSMHRHAGVDIVLITQNARKIHRDIRDLVSVEYRCIKKSMIGKDNEYIVKVHDGVAGHVNTTYERSYEKHIFPFYKSHTLSETSIKEDSSKQTNNISTKWTKLSVVFLVLGVVWFYKLLTSPDRFWNKDQGEQVTDQKIEVKKEPGIQTHESFPALEQQGEQHIPDVQKPSKVEKVIDDRTVNERLYDEYEKKSKTYHPYHTVDLHITSSSSYWDDEVRRIVHQITIGASRNGQMLFTFEHNDLWRAGYTMEVLGSCNIRVTYFDYEKFILCDVPTVEVANALDAGG